MANLNGGTVSVIDGATNQVIDTIVGGIGPSGLSVNPITNLIYVPNAGSNDVTVIQDGIGGTPTPITGGTPIPTPVPGESDEKIFEDFEDGVADNWEGSSQWSVADGMYQYTGFHENGTFETSLFNEIFSDVTIEADIKNGGTFISGIRFRVQPDNSGYTLSTGSSSYLVQKILPDGDLVSVIDRVSTSSLQSGWNKIKVESIGNTFRIFGNDLFLNSFIDSDYPIGKVGLRAVAVIEEVVNFDNVTISNFLTLATPTPAPTPIPTPDIKADFGASPSSGNIPLFVKFTDFSSPKDLIDTWLWDFGDGNISTQKNPSHTYTEEGKFDVSLTVSNVDDTNTVTKPNKISVTEIPVTVNKHEAVFIVDQTSGIVPFEARFTDLSENDPTKWVWDFGDGAGSIDQNPLHIYKSTGVFTVTLTVSNESGSDIVNKSNLITVEEDGSDDNKSFTVKCRQHKLIEGRAAVFEKMILGLGENEGCTVTLTDLEPGVLVEFSTLIRKGLKSAIRVVPVKGLTNDKGELEFTVSAISKGADWIAWAVKNDKGKFGFSKKDYDDGTAWGMFVEVK